MPDSFAPKGGELQKTFQRHRKDNKQITLRRHYCRAVKVLKFLHVKETFVRYFELRNNGQGHKRQRHKRSGKFAA